MSTLTPVIMAALVGTTVMVGALIIPTDDIFSETRASVNSANRWQLATALELYYARHQHYPLVEGGAALVDALAEEEHILSRPEDASVFEYAPQKDGQTYMLTVKK